MDKATRRRLERLLDDLLWLMCDSGVKLDGATRDDISLIRSLLDDTLSGGNP